jgi:hypothetical protein
MMRKSLLSLVCLGLACPVLADSFLVTTDADDGAGSLRAAVAAANASVSDDTITFDPGYDWTFIDLEGGQLEVTAPGKITITGAGLTERPILSGFGTSRVFLVEQGATLELDFVSVSFGQAPNGANGSDGEASTDGADGEHGGGIYNEGALIVRNSRIEANAAGDGGRGGEKTGVAAGSAGQGGLGGFGGGIYSTGAGASVRIENSFVGDNDAGFGGVGGRLGAGAAGVPGEGGGGGRGGGVYCAGGSLEIVNSRIETNRAGRGGRGGGDANEGTGGGGGRGGDGGGIGLDGCGIRIVDSTIRNNSAGSGGLGGAEPGSLEAVPGFGGEGGSGGGLWVRHFSPDPEAQISGCLFQSNRSGHGAAGGSYPGLAPGKSGTAGGSGGGGGGIFAIGNGPLLRLRNSTFLSNLSGDGGNGGEGSLGGGAGGAAGSGGGIALASAGGSYFAVLNHLTIVSNSTGEPGLEGELGAGSGLPASGGGVWEQPGGISVGPGSGVYLANSVVALNIADLVPNIGDFLPEGVNVTTGDPRLGPLSDNGGSTLTMAPLSGSPVLDRGGSTADPLSTDQRGRPRPLNGAPDIGAFEASRRADARIGARANPATHRIDNFYTLSGAGQVLPIRLVRMRSARYFVSVQNDGEIADNLRVTGTRANRTISLSAFRLTGGRANITGQLAAGRVFPSVAPQGIVAMQFNVRARSSKLRARQRLLCEARIPQVPGHDRVVANVTQAPQRRARR